MIYYIGVTAVTFFVALVLGWLLIPILRRMKIGQTVRDDGPKTHLVKSGIPTMGGVIFALAALIVSVFVIPRGNAQGYMLLFVMAAFGSIGFADDYIKVVLRQSLGLKARQKLLGMALVVALTWVALRLLNVEPTILVPFYGTINLGHLYPLFIAFILVGTTNAVNLTDGVDGLASGASVITLLTGMIIARSAGLEGVALAAAALAGALLGFMVFNLHPARVFMGDVGSLAIGGAVAMVAIFTKTEIFLALYGILYVMETISVMIQVTYFKLTGRRVFLMAPIHHHFELKGWSEWKICRWFWALQLSGSILGLLLWLGTVG